MIRKIIIFLTVILATPYVFAADPDVVGQEMDRFESRDAFTGTLWGGKTDEGVTAKYKAKPAAKTGAPVSGRHKQHEFNVGIEKYHYKYHEYGADGEKFMNLQGFYTALSASYTFRPFDMDSFARELANAFSIEAMYARGQVDYTGSTWGGDPVLDFGIKDYMYEVRGLIKNEYEWQSLEFCPYAGLGRRYLNNGRGAEGSYNRESEYLYVPLGVDINKYLPGGWGLGLNLEYDFFLYGEQISHLDNVNSSPKLDCITNRQDNGYGWRTSLKVVKELAHSKLTFEPYFRYWHIKDSQPELLTTNGIKIASPGHPGYLMAVFEPDNITQELGVKMGVQF